ncbi:MAG: hypothetical protein H6728_15000 [Myxococcales bacterium]|nr:hypothetical protein [Myxococcales bacterium]
MTSSKKDSSQGTTPFSPSSGKASGGADDLFEGLGDLDSLLGGDTDLDSFLDAGLRTVDTAPKASAPTKASSEPSKPASSGASLAPPVRSTMGAKPASSDGAGTRSSGALSSLSSGASSSKPSYSSKTSSSPKKTDAFGTPSSETSSTAAGTGRTLSSGALGAVSKPASTTDAAKPAETPKPSLSLSLGKKSGTKTTPSSTPALSSSDDVKATVPDGTVSAAQVRAKADDNRPTVSVPRMSDALIAEAAGKKKQEEDAKPTEPPRMPAPPSTRDAGKAADTAKKDDASKVAETSSASGPSKSPETPATTAKANVSSTPTESTKPADADKSAVSAKSEPARTVSSAKNTETTQTPSAEASSTSPKAAEGSKPSTDAAKKEDKPKEPVKAAEEPPKEAPKTSSTSPKAAEAPKTTTAPKAAEAPKGAVFGGAAEPSPASTNKPAAPKQAVTTAPPAAAPTKPTVEEPKKPSPAASGGSSSSTTPPASSQAQQPPAAAPAALGGLSLGKVVGGLAGIFLVGLIGARLVWPPVDPGMLLKGARSMVTPVAAQITTLEGARKSQGTEIASLKQQLGALVAQLQRVEGQAAAERTSQNNRHKALLARLAKQAATIQALEKAQATLQQESAAQAAGLKRESGLLATLDKSFRQEQTLSQERHQQLEKKHDALNQKAAEMGAQQKADQNTLRGLLARTKQHDLRLASAEKTLRPVPKAIKVLALEDARNKKHLERLVAQSEARSWMFTRIAADLKPLQAGLDEMKKLSFGADNRLKELEKDAKTFRMAVDNVSSTLPSAMQLLKALGERVNEQDERIKSLRKARRSISEAQQSFVALTQKVSGLEATIQSSQQAQRALQAQLRAAQASHANTRREINKRLAQGEKQAASGREILQKQWVASLGRLQQQANAQQKATADLQARTQGLFAQLAKNNQSLGRSLAALQKKFSEQASHFERQDSQINVMMRQVQAAFSSLARGQEQSEQLQKSLNTLQQDLKRLAAELAAMKKPPTIAPVPR